MFVSCGVAVSRIFILSLFMIPVSALAATTADIPASAVAATNDMKKVLVTGAAGKTGRLVMKKLLQRPTFLPIGVVRTEESRTQLSEEEDIPKAALKVADIRDVTKLKEVSLGMDALIICTSATPAALKNTTTEDGKPKFGFPNGQPYQVDWLGQKNQIDAAKAVKSIKHIVICSSMGGTNPDNPLNKIGIDPEDPKSGNILLWKRKAEHYLIQQCDSSNTMKYTIVHPGGLVDDEGGVRELVLGVDDQHVKTNNRSIPRNDVAELLIASLEHSEYENRSFDARSKAPDEDGAEVTTDYQALVQTLEGKNCDYSLGKIPSDEDGKDEL